MAEIVRIDDSTWRFEDGFVRFFLLAGNDRAVMIDSGVNCPEAAELAGTVTDKPIMLLNTHGDGDHTSGTGGFTEIYMHSADYVGCEVGTRFTDTALVPVKDGDVFELGGRTLKIIHIPGHTSGSIAILDVERRALYAGDSVQSGHIFMFGAKREPEKYEDSLKRLIAMRNEYDCIYASHDKPVLPGDYVERVKHAWTEVQSGNISYEMIDLFGNQVKSYTTEACGFYVQ